VRPHFHDDALVGFGFAEFGFGFGVAGIGYRHTLRLQPAQLLSRELRYHDDDVLVEVGVGVDYFLGVDDACARLMLQPQRQLRGQQQQGLHHDDDHRGLVAAVVEKLHLREYRLF
jgi:hypothetical protein